ncbi:unnamed protein product [Auanema sp. JU1783]|nr:unnamed protein product [Auanema sp. JU1783]
MGTLTVVDPDDSAVQSRFKQEKKQSKPKPEFYTSNSSSTEDRMCFLRWQIAIAVASTVVLLIITIFISTYIIHIKCIRAPDYGSVCSSSMSGTTYSSEYTTGSHGYQSPYVPSSRTHNVQDHARTYCVPQSVR